MRRDFGMLKKAKNQAVSIQYIDPSHFLWGSQHPIPCSYITPTSILFRIHPLHACACWIPKDTLHSLGSVHAERSYMCSVTAWSVPGTMLCKGFRNAAIPKENEMGQCIDWTPLVSLLFWSFQISLLFHQKILMQFVHFFDSHFDYVGFVFALPSCT